MSQAGQGGAGPTAYDVAGRYDDAYFADLADRYRRRNRFARTRIANVFRLLPPLRGLTVADLGCGMGTFTIEAARAGARAVGIDLAPAGIAAAARTAAAEGVPRAAFVHGDVVALPLAPGSVDVVLAADLTEHLDEDTFQRLLGEARRVLRPGGRLVLYTPDRDHVLERLREAGVLQDGDPSHIGMRTGAELAEAVRRAGLQVEAVRALPSHLPGLQLAERALGRWVPLLRRRAGVVALKRDT